MILVDTTILVYAVGSERPLRSPCRDLLRMIRDGLVPATASVEVVQEFAHVRARRSSRPEAAERAPAYARALSPLVQPDGDDLMEGVGLFETTADFGPFDAVLGATARRRGWTLVSADRSFSRVDRLRWLDPSSPGFLEAPWPSDDPRHRVRGAPLFPREGLRAGAARRQSQDGWSRTERVSTPRSPWPPLPGLASSVPTQG